MAQFMGKRNIRLFTLNRNHMKKLLFTSVFILVLTISNWATAQNRNNEYLGLPGDNLNLFAVMDLFQESETLEAFERGLNDPETMINNLDLNNDNYVDYLMVFDFVDGNIHSIVMRVAMTPDEYQDVAVFTVEKFPNETVRIQLIGDEALYGPNYIVEPNYAERPNPGYKGRITRQDNRVTLVTTTYYEVANWPIIVYIRRPAYRPWRSTWVWGYRPVWWNPWTPHYWHFYYGYHYNWHSHYYAHYRPWNHIRCTHYTNVYRNSVRNYSPTVIVNVNQGRYENTYSRPEKREEGEKLFVERNPSRNINNDGNSSGNRGEGRYGSSPSRSSLQSVTSGGEKSVRSSDSRSSSPASRPAVSSSGNQRANERSVNSVNGRTIVTSPNRSEREIMQESNRNERTVREPRATPARVVQQPTSPSRNASPQVNRRAESPARSRQEAAPVRETRQSPIRTVERPSRERRQNAQPAPARSVNRSSSERNNRSSAPTPARVSRSNESRSPSVDRSRSNSSTNRREPAVRSSERRETRPTRVAPSNQNTERKKTVRTERTPERNPSRNR
jgi:hypothetical protein